MANPQLTSITNKNQVDAVRDSIDAASSSLTGIELTRIKLNAIAHVISRATHFELDTKRLKGLGFILNNFNAEIEKSGGEAIAKLDEAYRSL